MFCYFFSIEMRKERNRSCCGWLMMGEEEEKRGTDFVGSQIHARTRLSERDVQCYALLFCTAHHRTVWMDGWMFRIGRG